MLPETALPTAVGGLRAYVQGESLKARRVFLAEASQLPDHQVLGVPTMSLSKFAPFTLKLCFFLSLALPSAATAQNASDCTGKPFPLRPFPQRVIEGYARNDSGDPLNTIVGPLYGRCHADRVAVTFVCGAYARRNRNGYIDRARDFYGEYDFWSATFKFIARDAAAVKACARNVLVTGTSGRTTSR